MLSSAVALSSLERSGVPPNSLHLHWKGLQSLPSHKVLRVILHHFDRNAWCPEL